MRLIDKDALMEDINESLSEMTNIGIAVDGDWLWAKLNDAIEHAPTIEERKTGKWINNIHDIPICDQCGYMTPYDRAIDDYEYGNYCPNCGADMREQP